MASKLLPPFDDDEIETEFQFYHTWEIEAWDALPDKLYSPVFAGGDYNWKLYLFPKGNKFNSVSIYLACAPKGQDPADPDKDAPHWTCCAQFGIVMWNPDEPSIWKENKAHHRFEAEESDWGFSQFYDLRMLYNRTSTSEHAMIENNKVNFSVYIKIVKDVTGVLWHNFRNYNSKKETGFSGIRNQGATCYMNSLLQSLYFTTAFRHAVMGIPTEDEPDKVPAALQRVFFQLNTSSDGVDTRKLTKSFGWDSGDAFTQHDVQELNRVLMDNLEGKMKGTSVEGMLNKIFVGQMKSYIKCVNVDFESSRIEDYWDIQLNVKGMKNLEDSFKDYVQVETLDGENQYQATGFGLQDAKKGVVFTSFPPVLHLQLKRYDFDFIREQMVKINDRYEFPTEIDLSPYLDESIVPEESCEYALHGVLVHCGDLNIGHYYALIKPKKDGQWYKFDDELVTKATMKEVLEDNFGGDLLSSDLTKSRVSNLSPSYKRHTSAYMLVYIRKSRVDEILFDDKVPQHIMERVKAEIEEEERARREREEQHLYMSLKVSSIEQFRKLNFFDLSIWKQEPGLEDQSPESYAVTYKVKKSSTPAEFIDQIAKSINFAYPERLRLWKVEERDNKTKRPSELIDTSSTLTLEQIFANNIKMRSELNIYLDVADVDEKTGELIPWVDNDLDLGPRILLFIKVFDPETQSIHGFKTWVGRANYKVSVLIPEVLKALGWDSDTKIRLLEEVKPNFIEETNLEETFQEASIGDGDIICVEKAEPDLSKIPVGGYKNATDYYNFLLKRLHIVFRRRIDHEGFSDETENSPTPDIDLWLNANDDYDQVSSIVGEKLNVDPTHLQFFVTNPNGTVKQAIKRKTTVSHMIISFHGVTPHVILYDVLPVSLKEYETKQLVRFIYLTDGISQEHRHEVLLPQAGKVQDIIPYFESKIKLSAENISKLHFWASSNHLFLQEVTLATPVAEVVKHQTLYAQVLTDEELKWVRDGSDVKKGIVIKVYQFHKDPTSTHGVPFQFLLKAGEPFRETKVRLQKKLGMFDKLFERIKFAIVDVQHYDECQGSPYVDDDDEVLYEQFVSDPELMLGLDHMNRAPRRMHTERAIFIKD
ncbi:hypothetical protein D0Z03_000611 [Geotrichum reessii]|nr:hypothetical protein D0Z03_000611 [Galactomyces reessii]